MLFIRRESTRSELTRFRQTCAHCRHVLTIAERLFFLSQALYGSSAQTPGTVKFASCSLSQGEGSSFRVRASVLARLCFLWDGAHPNVFSRAGLAPRSVAVV